MIKKMVIEGNVVFNEYKFLKLILFFVYLDWIMYDVKYLKSILG